MRQSEDALADSRLPRPTSWLRGPAEYRDGLIVLDRSRARECPMGHTPEVIFDLASVREPQDAVAYVQRYGLLTNGPESDRFEESFRMWTKEAWALQDLLEAYHFLKGALQESKGAIHALREHYESLNPDCSVTNPPSDAKVMMDISDWIAAQVTEHLARANEGLITYRDNEGNPSPGQFVFCAYSKDLLAAVYYRLSLLIAESTPTRMCAECGRFFAVHDQRQMYCSDTCGNRARYRRYRAKSAGEE